MNVGSVVYQLSYTRNKRKKGQVAASGRESATGFFNFTSQPVRVIAFLTTACLGLVLFLANIYGGNDATHKHIIIPMDLGVKLLAA